jgi:hypothetical protein
MDLTVRNVARPRNDRGRTAQAETAAVRPGDRSRKEILKDQRSTDLLIRKLPFARPVKPASQELFFNTRF